jgi:hypothetical protein
MRAKTVQGAQGETNLSAVPRTWILTGSIENLRATREHGFRVIGAKEGRRGMAEQI